MSISGLFLRQSRPFSHSAKSLSYIGKAPIYMTPGVDCKVTEVENPRIILKGRKEIKLSNNINVIGPKGSLNILVPKFVELVVQPPEESNDFVGKIQVSIKNEEEKLQKSMWGTVASLLQNHVTGVTEGHMAIVKLVGTGYRATIIDSPNNSSKKFVSLKLGMANLQGLEIPDHLSVSCPAPTRIVIEGIDKQQVNLFAAKLREFRKPEPYKGKGIFVNDETIKIKDKKIK